MLLAGVAARVGVPSGVGGRHGAAAGCDGAVVFQQAAAVASASCKLTLGLRRAQGRRDRGGPSANLPTPPGEAGEWPGGAPARGIPEGDGPGRAGGAGGPLRPGVVRAPVAAPSGPSVRDQGRAAGAVTPQTAGVVEWREHVTDVAGVEGDDAGGQFQVNAHSAGVGGLPGDRPQPPPETGSL